MASSYDSPTLLHWNDNDEYVALTDDELEEQEEARLAAEDDRYLV